MTIVFYLCYRGYAIISAVLIIIVTHEWIEVSLLSTILICDIKSPSLIVETDTCCDTVGSLPIGVVAAGGISCTRRGYALVTITSVSEHHGCQWQEPEGIDH